MQNTSKNNSELFPPTHLPKPITSTHASAAQIAAALGFEEVDDAFLRNRAREGVIPKPIKSRYEINATTIGLLKWYRSRAAAKSELPAQYANMQAMSNALGLDKKAVKFLLKNGAGEAQDTANRIAPLPVIRRAFEIITQVADGAITGIAGLEQWNKDTELAKKLRLEAEQLQHDKLIREGETLLARDSAFAVSQLVADQLVVEKLDLPLRAALLAAPKQINRQHRTILKTAGVPRAVMDQCDAVTTQTIGGVLTKLRAKIPKRMNLKPVETE